MKNGGKILVVDDTVESLSLLTKLLTQEGYEVFPANSGELALTSLNKKIPDLILLDIQMPGINGFEVCRRIKMNDQLKLIPVIFITIESRLNDKIEGFKLGAVDYITKPFEKEELLARVKTHIELYTYHKLFKDQTAENLIENKKLVNQQNADYKILNDKLEESYERIKKMNSALELKNEESTIINENLFETNKRLHIAVAELKEREIQLNELNATKDKLFTILAHDLKNPFSSIIGMSKLLIRNFKKYDNKKNENLLTQVYNSAAHTYDLLNNLLDWARSQTGKLSFNPIQIDLNSALKEIVDNLNSIAKSKNIALNCFQSADISFLADATMLNIVLRNLILNGIKFTNPGGKVDLYSMIENNHVEIAISDTGIGIDKENISKLFDINKLYSTQGTGNEKGTGLGLILCKELVEKHGGKIWVESIKDKGTTFYFTIPILDKECADIVTGINK